MAYCTDTDVIGLIGDIQLRSGWSAQDAANAASEEIDSRIGFAYNTPVFQIADFEVSTVSRAAKLLLKKLCSFIAAGRLIMSYSQQGEDNQPNAYAKYLLDQSYEILTLLAEGRLPLDGAIPSGGDGPPQSRAGVNNVDPYSQVEAFYGWAARPPSPLDWGHIPLLRRFQ